MTFPAAARQKVPFNTQLWLDAVMGDDAYDGTDESHPAKTFNHLLRYVIKDCFDLSGISNYPNACVTINLLPNAVGGITDTPYDTVHLAFQPVGAEGRNSILIQGQGSSTVISSPGAPAVSAYGPTSLSFRNLQLGQSSAAKPLTGGGVQAADGASIFVHDGVIFGHCQAAQISTYNGGRALFYDGFNGCGDADNLASTSGPGSLVDLGPSVNFANPVNYRQQTLSALDVSTIVANTPGGNFTGSAVTGRKFYIRNNALLLRGDGDGHTIPGDIAGINSNALVV